MKIMKIDKNNPKHLLALILFGFVVFTTIVFRKIKSKRNKKQKTIVLYGHKLTGNLLAIYDYWKKKHKKDFELKFLTMDIDYYRCLKKDDVNVTLTSNLKETVTLLTTVDAVISSHGLHTMEWLVNRTNIKFFDVWHGIPFKGFDADDFRVQHKYDETWVASPLNAKLYAKRFGFHESRIKVTGYARTDQLAKPLISQQETKQRFQLPQNKPTILLAPTWQQDSKNRSIYPFGTTEDEFLSALDQFAQQHNVFIVLRAHLNDSEVSGNSFKNILYRPFADYPNTEALLYACDSLVCDWSSIAFDWLVLQRPTIFLDVPAPFAKGFSLGPEYRFDTIVNDMSGLLIEMEQALQPMTGQKKKEYQIALEKIYGNYADGNSSQRCIERLLKHLES